MPVNADFKQGKEMAQPEPGWEKWGSEKNKVVGIVVALRL